MKKILTGLQPSGSLHIGNYFGAIKPILDLQKEENELFLFIANYHSLTTIKDQKTLKENTFNACLDLLSLGLDPEKITFFIQSDVKEVLELNLILSNLIQLGHLERAHGYKDKVSKGIKPNLGLFSYPVLMSADILLYDIDIVPVGKDQIQHVEIARDIAVMFNEAYGKYFKLPEFKVSESVSIIKGTDGQKMSKSYKNTVPIFGSKKDIKKSVNSIITDSKNIEDVKDYSKCTIYNLCELFMNDNELNNLKDRYNTPGEGYGHFKITLLEKINDYFQEASIYRENLLKEPKKVYEVMNYGKEKASSIAKRRIEEIRNLVGL
jgi:tryptophanyl-tRNA synthetase